MNSKEIGRNLLINAVDSKDESGLKTEYRLFEDTLDERKSYSIEVATTLHGVCETARADDVTSLAEDADKIFKLISGNSVTACALFDVLEDAIGTVV